MKSGFRKKIGDPVQAELMIKKGVERMPHSSKLESINPDLIPAVMNRVDEVIDRLKGKQGCLIPVLEECQGIVGYLPVELQSYIGDRLSIPESTIYGVVTFYSF